MSMDRSGYEYPLGPNGTTDSRMTRGYTCYYHACRADKVKNPVKWDMPLAVFFDTLEANWEGMSEKERAPYMREAKIHNQTVFKKAGKRFPYRAQQETQGEKKKRTKDPDAPKRPKNAFFLFCNDHRATAKAKYGPHGGNYAKILGSMWSKADNNTRTRYIVMAENDQKRYKMEMEEYNKQKKTSDGSSSQLTDGN